MVTKSSRSGNRRVVFALAGEPGHDIHVSGSFNDWSPAKKKMKDKKGDGVYAAICMLAPGKHQYKFIVDGIWVNDMENASIVPDGHGGLNNVIEVE